jgi:hypothetical protein
MKLTRTPCLIEEVAGGDRHHRIRLQPTKHRDEGDRQQQAEDLDNKIKSQTFGIIRDLGIKPKSTSKTTTSIYSNAPPRPTPVGNSGREAIGVDRSLAVDSEYCRLAREVERGK